MNVDKGVEFEKKNCSYKSLVVKKLMIVMVIILNFILRLIG